MPKISLPKSGWNPISRYDAQGEGARCEVPKCNRRLRWVHVIEHERFNLRLQVGSCCATRLCENYDAEVSELELRLRANRRRRFLDCGKWRPSRRNPANLVRTIRVPDVGEVIVTIFQCRNGLYHVSFISAKRRNNKHTEWTNSETVGEALARAFDLIGG